MLTRCSSTFQRESKNRGGHKVYAELGVLMRHLTAGVVGISDSFALDWDPFSPNGLCCPALMGRDVPSLTVICYAIFC